MSSIAYLRSAYGIPAKKGMRVKLKKAYFNIPSDGGVITGAKHAYLRIRVDGEKHSRFFHPTYGVIYPAVEHTLAEGRACTCPLSDSGSILYYSQECAVHALPPAPKA